MARKKKPEDHENLERWLVSYADFMTLLFATFVVLYALSQINVNEFKKIEESIRKAFSVQSILDGGSGVITSGKTMIDAQAADSVIDSLMMEFISQKYEQESYEQIKKEVENLNKSGELSGVTAKIDERGLVIVVSDKDLLFKSGSAELTPEAKNILEKVGKLIVEKFAMQIIKVEGHTDNIPISGGKYPSNWELSSARASAIVRFLIDRFKILPNLMAAVGYAETRPAEKGTDASALAKNRRVEIVVQRNQFKNLDHYQNLYLKMDKMEQQRRRNEQIRIIKEIDNREFESLGEDVRNNTLLETTGTSFLEESKRLQELSTPD